MASFFLFRYWYTLIFLSTLKGDAIFAHSGILSTLKGGVIFGLFDEGDILSTLIELPGWNFDHFEG